MTTANTILLAEWLQRAPEEFADMRAQGMVGELLAHVNAAREVNANYRLHCSRWGLLSEEQRLLAMRKQIAALMGRCATRNGLSEAQAAAWVIGIAAGSREHFAERCQALLKNGDKLHVWQWQEVCMLGLEDDFMSHRAVLDWMAKDGPWAMDERWIYPLHLVDEGGEHVNA